MSLGPLMMDLEGTSITAEERELMAHPLVGGVILFTRNYVDPEQLTELVAGIHAVRTPPLIVAVDQEGGRVQRFQKGFTRLPPARLIGHAFDQDPKAGLELARRTGWLMASELRSHGVDISFAPVVDLDYGVNEAIGWAQCLHSQRPSAGKKRTVLRSTLFTSMPADSAAFAPLSAKVHWTSSRTIIAGSLW